MKSKKTSPTPAAKEIKRRRLAIRLSASALAEAAGFSNSYLNHVEKGRSGGSPQFHKAINAALLKAEGGGNKNTVTVKIKPEQDPPTDPLTDVYEAVAKIGALTPEQRSVAFQMIQLRYG